MIWSTHGYFHIHPSANDIDLASHCLSQTALAFKCCPLKTQGVVKIIAYSISGIDNDLKHTSHQYQQISVHVWANLDKKKQRENREWRGRMERSYNISDVKESMSESHLVFF